MWQNLLDRLTASVIKQGDFGIRFPDGTARRYGDGTGTAVTIEIHDDATVAKLVRNPELALGEAYMNGTVTIDDDDLHNFFRVLTLGPGRRSDPSWMVPSQVLARVMRRVQQFNPTGKAQRNVAHHYDLSAELYDLFLDEDRQYSCAYFQDPDMSLEDAQLAKKRHIARKLLIEPDMRVLDIGCGWGGMALTLAREFGARVTGVTLSQEQHKIACERAESEGLEHLVEFRLSDYRNVREEFDRIVSVGMFEHVGLPHYREYFRNVRERLAPDGVALIHTIGRAGRPSYTSPWIAKYIFPGGYVPSMSELSTAIEHEALYPTDIEIWRLHYAKTLRHWFDRFTARIDEAEKLYDARFCRMWKYYLVASEQAFRYGRQCVFQVQLAHHQQAVPLTRDYLYEKHENRQEMAAQ